VVEVVMMMVRPLSIVSPALVPARVMVPDDDVLVVPVSVNLDVVVVASGGVTSLVVLGRGRDRGEGQDRDKAGEDRLHGMLRSSVRNRHPVPAGLNAS
jgi:hypothetical protein